MVFLKKKKRLCAYWMQTPGIIVNEKRDKNF